MHPQQTGDPYTDRVLRLRKKLDGRPILIRVRHGQKPHREIQVGNDQEKAQSEKDSHSKNRGGKKLN